MVQKIICIGGATIDRKLKTRDALELATSNPASSVTTFGGVAHNVAKNLIQLTQPIYLQCVVGNDSEGRDLLSHLKNAGINTDMSLVRENKTTAHYYAILDHQGELHLAIADMEIYDDVPFDSFTQSWCEWHPDDIIFLDTNLPAPLIEHAITLSKQKQLTLCIDTVSMAKAKKLPAQLEGVFLIKPDRFEAEVLANRSIHSIKDCMEAGKVLLQKGVKNVVITLGQSGYVITNEFGQKHVAAIETKSVVDVSGAGDAFIAGILYELKKGSSIHSACELGARAAFLTLQSERSVSTLKTLTMKKEDLDHATIF